MTFVDVPSDLAWCTMSTGSIEGDPVSFLTTSEEVRLDSFAHEDRRVRFALGRMAARGLLADRLGITPLDVPLTIAQDDALDVAGHAVQVSVSHGGRGPTARSIALIGDRPLGVDLEEIVPRREDLYRRILHTNEYGLLESLDLPHNEAQLLLWSLKEAVLKGLRTGFRRPAKTVHLDDLAGGKGHAHMDDGPSWNLRYARDDGFWITLAFLD